MYTESDYSKLINLQNIDLNKLKNKTVVVTGASGLIGSAFCGLINYINSCYNLSIKLIPVCTSKKKIFQYESQTWENFPKTFDFLVHAGAPTSSSYFKQNPTETFLDIINKTKICLEAVKNNRNSKGVILSTIEIYGDSGKEELKEKDIGYIDLDNPRSSYPLGKRAAEFLAKSYCSEYGVNICIARLTQTFGKGVKWSDQRVFAYFAKCLLLNRDISLATPGLLKRAYLDILDAVTAIIYILIKGESGLSYNVSNPKNYIAVKDLAKLFLLHRPDLKLRIDLDENLAQNFAPQIGTNLSISLIEELGWQPERSLSNTIADLILSMDQSR